MDHSAEMTPNWSDNQWASYYYSEIQRYCPNFSLRRNEFDAVWERAKELYPGDLCPGIGSVS